MSDKQLHTLTVCMSRHLAGHPINDVIAKDWSKAVADQVSRFDNVGFDLDGEDVPGALALLKEALAGHPWDGVLVGWCIRGKLEHTVIFEDVMALCTEVTRVRPRN